jgi:hypothetical protein
MHEATECCQIEESARFLSPSLQTVISNELRLNVKKQTLPDPKSFLLCTMSLAVWHKRTKLYDDGPLLFQCMLVQYSVYIPCAYTVHAHIQMHKCTQHTNTNSSKRYSTCKSNLLPGMSAQGVSLSLSPPPSPSLSLSLSLSCQAQVVLCVLLLVIIMKQKAKKKKKTFSNVFRQTTSWRNTTICLRGKKWPEPREHCGFDDRAMVSLSAAE